MPTILKGEAMCQVGGFKLERHSSQNVKTSVPKFGEQSSTQLVKCSVKLERSLQMRKWRNLYMNLIVHTKFISFFLPILLQRQLSPTQLSEILYGILRRVQSPDQVEQWFLD